VGKGQYVPKLQRTYSAKIERHTLMVYVLGFKALSYIIKIAFAPEG
jgi:hypothetical protein